MGCVWDCFHVNAVVQETSHEKREIYVAIWMQCCEKSRCYAHDITSSTLMPAAEPGCTAPFFCNEGLEPKSIQQTAVHEKAPSSGSFSCYR